jgi:hypothetical protein
MVMNEGRQKSSWDLDELTELSAWQGYEFWSSQLETEMEFSADFEQAEGFHLIQLEMKEGKNDVLPF